MTKKKKKKTLNFEQLNALMEQDQKRMKEHFNAYIVIGLRKIPEEDREKHKGSEEVPFWYFYGSPSIAGGLSDWASSDIKRKQAIAELTEETESPEKLDKEDV